MLRTEFQCPVCLQLHGSAVGADEHVAPKMCEEHQKWYDDGYVFLIVADEEDKNNGDAIDEILAKRTGEFIGIHAEDAEANFTDFRHTEGIAFITPNVYQALRERSNGE